MSLGDSFRTLAEQRLAAFCRAKDGNRPHLMGQAFADDAWLESVPPAHLAGPPSVAQGREAITRGLVRHFGRTYENVYTFCLPRPGRPSPADRFDCDWLAAMSLKDDGRVRVGCGRFEGCLQPDPPYLLQGLRVSVAVMRLLPAEALPAVTDWLAALPYPWCPAQLAWRRAPLLPALHPVLAHLAGCAAAAQAVPRPAARRAPMPTCAP